VLTAGSRAVGASESAFEALAALLQSECTLPGAGVAMTIASSSSPDAIVEVEPMGAIVSPKPPPPAATAESAASPTTVVLPCLACAGTDGTRDATTIGRLPEVEGVGEGGAVASASATLSNAGSCGMVALGCCCWERPCFSDILLLGAPAAAED
jgi:hypothetical protein